MRASWLIPVRDGAPWLRAAVESALAQIRPGDEAIVIDDGSRRDPAAILPAHPALSLIRQPPLGIAAALEAGRAAARGEALLRLDADDEALPGRVQAQVAALEADPQLAAVGGRARALGEVGEGMARYMAWVGGLADLRRELLVESPLFHPAVALRASAVAAVGGYRDGDFPEDYDLWLRLAAAGWRLANLPADVVAIRDRPDRLTRADPRYRRDAFTRLKMGFLAQTRLSAPARVAVWGAGRSGRPWIRWLQQQGHAVPAVIDLFQGGERRGVPVLPPAALPGLSFDLLLVAVGAAGARSEIRRMLADLRPDLAEGEGWIAVC